MRLERLGTIVRRIAGKLAANDRERDGSCGNSIDFRAPKSGANLVNVPSADTKTPSDISDALGLNCGDDLGDLIVSKPHAGMRVPAQAALSPLGDFVRHVVGGCAEKKMIGINAGGGIAPMANKHSIGDFSPEYLERDPVRRLETPLIAHHAIPIFPASARPNTASVGGNGDVICKAPLNRYASHLSAHRRNQKVPASAPEGSTSGAGKPGGGEVQAVKSARPRGEQTVGPALTRGGAQIGGQRPRADSNVVDLWAWARARHSHASTTRTTKHTAKRQRPVMRSPARASGRRAWPEPLP